VRRKSNVAFMTGADAQITVPETARRLGLPGDDVYRLIFRGELVGGPAGDGAVYVSVTSLEEYLAQHRASHVEGS
jgi:hypothetical protein